MNMKQVKDLKVGEVILRRVTDYTLEPIEVKGISIDQIEKQAYITFDEAIGYQLACSVDAYVITT